MLIHQVAPEESTTVTQVLVELQWLTLSCQFIWYMQLKLMQSNRTILQSVLP